jgi:hypothetical protein
MDSKQHVQFLRVQLLCMSRLLQRALDYAIKGYQLGNPDFSRQACAMEHKLGEHHHQIRDLCHKITVNGVTDHRDFHSVLAALRIHDALLATYEAAMQIARDTIMLLERGSLAKCTPLDRFGRFVNSMIRLCTVSLFEREDRYAEAVLQSRRIWRRYELIFDPSSGDVDQKGVHSYALAIPQSLGVIAKQAHEMADAILFWLKGMETEAAHDAGGYDMPNFLSRSGDYEDAECCVAVIAS